MALKRIAVELLSAAILPMSVAAKKRWDFAELATFTRSFPERNPRYAVGLISIGSKLFQPRNLGSTLRYSLTFCIGQYLVLRGGLHNTTDDRSHSRRARFGR